MFKSIQPIHLAVTGCVILGIALGITTASYATTEQDKKCYVTPAPPTAGNCSCEMPDSYYTCAQSIGAYHNNYYCVPSTGDECSSPTTSCGLKYECWPKKCDDPTRDCDPTNHNCQDPPSGELMYGCVTL